MKRERTRALARNPFSDVDAYFASIIKLLLLTSLVFKHTLCNYLEKKTLLLIWQTVLDPLENLSSICLVHMYHNLIKTSARARVCVSSSSLIIAVLLISIISL